MANIAELAIQLTARTDKLNKGLASARNSVKKFVGGIAAAAKKLAAFAAIVGVGLAAAFAVSARKVAQYGDTIAKMARRTGFATTALQEIKFAAELAGSDIESVEKASRTLSGTILDLERGLSTAKDGFADLGLSLEDVKGQSPERQLELVFGALNKIEDSSRRAALAADLFGRAGTQLLPLAADFQALRKEAGKLGIVFDKDKLKASEDFQDSVLRIKGAILGVQGAVIDLKPLTAIFNAIAKSISRIREDLVGSAGGVEGLTSATFALQRAFIPVQATIEAVFGNLGNFASIMVTAFDTALSIIGERIEFALSTQGTNAIENLITVFVASMKFALSAWKNFFKTVATIAFDNFKAINQGFRALFATGDFAFAAKNIALSLQASLLGGLDDFATRLESSIIDLNKDVDRAILENVVVFKPSANLDQLEDRLKNLTEDFQSGFADATERIKNDLIDSLLESVFAGLDAAGDDDDDDGDGDKARPVGPQALVRGSAAAFTAALRGRRRSPEVIATEKTNSILEASAVVLEDIKDAVEGGELVGITGC